jgi:hypothetical protein
MHPAARARAQIALLCIFCFAQGLTPQALLETYLYSGMVLIGMKRFKEASFQLYLVWVVPSSPSGPGPDLSFRT